MSFTDKGAVGVGIIAVLGAIDVSGTVGATDATRKPDEVDAEGTESVVEARSGSILRSILGLHVGTSSLLTDCVVRFCTNSSLAFCLQY